MIFYLNLLNGVKRILLHFGFLSFKDLWGLTKKDDLVVGRL